MNSKKLANWLGVCRWNDSLRTNRAAGKATCRRTTIFFRHSCSELTLSRWFNIWTTMIIINTLKVQCYNLIYSILWWWEINSKSSGRPSDMGSALHTQGSQNISNDINKYNIFFEVQYSWKLKLKPRKKKKKLTPTPYIAGKYQITSWYFKRGMQHHFQQRWRIITMKHFKGSQ